MPTAKDTAVSTFKELRDQLGRANVVQFKGINAIMEASTRNAGSREEESAETIIRGVSLLKRERKGRPDKGQNSGWKVQIVLDGRSAEHIVRAKDEAGKASRGLTREGILNQEIQRKHKMPTLTRIVLLFANKHEPETRHHWFPGSNYPTPEFPV